MTTGEFFLRCNNETLKNTVIEIDNESEEDYNNKNQDNNNNNNQDNNPKKSSSSSSPLSSSKKKTTSSSSSSSSSTPPSSSIPSNRSGSKLSIHGITLFYKKDEGYYYQLKSVVEKECKHEEWINLLFNLEKGIYILKEEHNEDIDGL